MSGRLAHAMRTWRPQAKPTMDRRREPELRRSGGMYRWRNRTSGTSVCTTRCAGSRRAPAPYTVALGLLHTSSSGPPRGEGRRGSARNRRRQAHAHGGTGHRHGHARDASHARPSSHPPSRLRPRSRLRRALGLSKSWRRGACDGPQLFHIQQSSPAMVPRFQEARSGPAHGLCRAARGNRSAPSALCKDSNLDADTRADRWFDSIQRTTKRLALASMQFAGRAGAWERSVTPRRRG